PAPPPHDYGPVGGNPPAGTWGVGRREDAPPAARYRAPCERRHKYYSPLPPGEGLGVRGKRVGVPPHPRLLSRGERGDTRAGCDRRAAGRESTPTSLLRASGARWPGGESPDSRGANGAPQTDRSRRAFAALPDLRPEANQGGAASRAVNPPESETAAPNGRATVRSASAAAPATRLSSEGGRSLRDG